ncbi:DUF6968 family protein [Polyangium jinanense]|uniref:DUF6968 domain-containing protein n=1 Tax=Polyangium jinanense TaxID=2829994 RepID=A0A9X3X063_9BACT|nr:hypothetical protein [Polyangium jinanense]MDC3954901.1 hypothetical protein [Polyangium jinanense]MDC3981329.1 hypothetical protein [Polyangium jinanense]
MAERRLERRDAVGGIVVVRVGFPEWPPGAEEWRCPFRILGLGDDSIQLARSVDSIAAIQNAIRGIYRKLVQSGVPLRREGFDDDDENDTGFSLEADRGWGLAFTQRIEQMILDEEAKLPGPTRERQKRKARRKAPAKPRMRTISDAERPRWIAERKLVRCDTVGSIIMVRLSYPESYADENVWKCAFTFEGLDDDLIYFSHGDDSMGALQKALRGIRSKLVQSGVPLRWALSGLEENDIGFSMEADRGHGLAFTRRIEQMILDEEEKYLQRSMRERQEHREARRKARAKPQPK